MNPEVSVMLARLSRHLPRLVSKAPSGRGGWDDVIPGEKITLLLGDPSTKPTGRRAVRGELVAFQPRDLVRVDALLRNLETWIVDAGPRDIEILPPDFESLFSLDLHRSVKETLEFARGHAPHGRARTAAAEYRWEQCPNCGEEAEGGVFCHGCGTRLSVGYPSVGQMTELASDPAGACSACWLPRNEADKACRHCGERTRDLGLSDFSGQRVRIQLTRNRRKASLVEGTIDALRYQKIFGGSGPQLVARLARISCLRRGGLREALPGDFTQWVTLSHSGAPVEPVLHALQSGDLMRGAEVKERCPTCSEYNKGGQVPFVLGCFCVGCGARRRIDPLPKGTSGGRGSGNVHPCGTRYRTETDRHCGGCGERLPGGAPANGSGTGRFAQISWPAPREKGTATDEGRVSGRFARLG